MEDNFVKIYEINDYQDDNSTWIEEVLTANNIEFKREIEEYWGGSTKLPQYMKKLIIYVAAENEAKVNELIQEYQNAQIPQNEIPEELKDCKEDEPVDNSNRNIIRIFYIAIGIIIVTIIALCFKF